MVKFSFMTWSTPNLTLDEDLALAKRLGYDGIEPRTSGKVEPEVGDHKTQKHGIEVYATAEQRREIRSKAEDSGIALCCLATSVRLADPANEKAELDYTRRAIALCSDIACPRIRVFGGAYPDSMTREQAIDQMVTALREVADEAQSAGITLCLETHDSWSDARPVAEVMKGVNHPAVQVNWDFIHPWRRVGTDVEDSFNIVKPWIRHCHCHDAVRTEGEKTESRWIGEGELDHAKAFQLLDELEAEVYMSGEWINRKESYEEHLTRELATLKRYAEEVRACPAG